MDAPAWMFTKALSHRQKTLRLFKRAMRCCDDWYRNEILENSFQKRIVRARFDEARDEKDTRKSQLMLMEGCKEIWHKKHPSQFAFAFDAFGVAYDRLRPFNDGIWDNWNFVEREAFPYYYNRREQRKKELLKHWIKIEDSWDKEIEEIQRVPPASTAQAIGSASGGPSLGAGAKKH